MTQIQSDKEQLLQCDTSARVIALFDRYEHAFYRYLEAEKFIADLLPLHKRIFSRRKIIKFLKSRLDYDKQFGAMPW